MGSLFSGSSVEECIEKASKAFNVPSEKLKYKITKDQKHFFRRKVEIEISEESEELTKDDEASAAENDARDKKVGSESINSIYTSERILNNGAKVENGKIIVKDFEDENTAITIEPCKEVILIVNGKKCNSKTQVNSNDKIEYSFVEEEVERNANVAITTNKLEAYLTIKVNPQSEFKLVDTPYEKNLKLNVKKIGEKYPPKYTAKELKEVLLDRGIRNGILEKELEEICDEYNVTEKLVAKGTPAEDDIPDQIKLYFNSNNELIDYDTQDSKVDYRNRYLINNVTPGDVLAEFIPGTAGKNGMDVFGIEIKRKAAKKLLLKAGENCTLENNKVISNVEGRPSIRGNTIVVNRVYTIDQVDLKSGNIDFVGNVEIAKNVEEGMKVIAGGELSIGRNVENAEIQSGGQVIVSGNVLGSTVKSGAENVAAKTYTNNIIQYKNYIENIIESAAALKDSNLLRKSRYGEVVKLLIENKFKALPELSKKILNYNVSNGIKESELTSFIINKMLGLGPLKINDSGELKEFCDVLNEEIDDMESASVIAADIYIDYAQGAKIESSGNVYITGKGQYTSNILALGNIEFTAGNSVCRGGELTAGNEIKLKTVGSTAGVSTVLKVPKNGKITADIAYSNTLFCFGDRQLLLETSSKDLVAYLDKKNDVVIEKFVL
jgi:uncharacterized protein